MKRIKLFNESKNDDDYFKEISYWDYTKVGRMDKAENWTKEELQSLVKKIESIILKRNKVEIYSSPFRIQESSLLFIKDNVTNTLNLDVSLRGRDIDKLFKPEVRHFLLEIRLGGTWHHKYSSKPLRIHKLQDEWFILKTPVNQFQCDQLSGLVYLLEKIIIEHEID